MLNSNPIYYFSAFLYCTALKSVIFKSEHFCVLYFFYFSSYSGSCQKKTTKTNTHVRTHGSVMPLNPETSALIQVCRYSREDNFEFQLIFVPFGNVNNAIIKAEDKITNYK